MESPYTSAGVPKRWWGEAPTSPDFSARGSGGAGGGPPRAGGGGCRGGGGGARGAAGGGRAGGGGGALGAGGGAVPGGGGRGRWARRGRARFGENSCPALRGRERGGAPRRPPPFRAANQGSSEPRPTNTLGALSLGFL